MNDENDKPENQPSDDWAMTMPDFRLSDEKKSSDSATDFSGDAAPQAPSAPPADDWGMTEPNRNIPQQNQPPSSDFDKTAPNLNVPQEFVSEPTGDWGMTTPNDGTSQAEKQDSWEMPKPVFRVSSGTTSVPVPRQIPSESFDKSSPDADFSGATTPYYNLDETKPQTVPAAPQSQVSNQTAAPQAQKKGSKMPFIIGGLLVMFVLAVAFLGVIYYLFLNKSQPVQVVSKSENVPSNSNSAPIAPVSTKTDLPKEVQYKTAMLLISAGAFTMGSDSGEDISKPAHQVTLPAFYIDKYEVTNAQYKEFCDATQKSYPPDFLEENYFLKRPDAPVVGVSFADAQAYAAWAGKRLPTEEEWEKAASWDDAAQAKREFPWGNDFQTGNAAFGLETVSDVGKFSSGASPAGAMDMAGNVLEWVDAYFQPYPNSSATSAEFGEKNRVVRGGFFKSNSKDMLKTTKRIYILPDTQSREDESKQIVAPIGFRCAVSADEARFKDFLQTQSK